MSKLKELVDGYIDEHQTTREAIARELGMSKSSYFQKMRGEYDFSFEEAYKLSKMLDVTMDELYAITRAAA